MSAVGLSFNFAVSVVVLDADFIIYLSFGVDQTGNIKSEYVIPKRFVWLAAVRLFHMFVPVEYSDYNIEIWHF